MFAKTKTCFRITAARMLAALAFILLSATVTEGQGSQSIIDYQDIIQSNGFLPNSRLSLDLSQVRVRSLGVSELYREPTEDDFDFTWHYCRSEGIDALEPVCTPAPVNGGTSGNRGRELVMTEKPPNGYPYIVIRLLTLRAIEDIGGRIITEYRGRIDTSRQAPSVTLTGSSFMFAHNVVRAEISGGNPNEDPDPRACMIAATADACGHDFPFGVSSIDATWRILDSGPPNGGTLTLGYSHSNERAQIGAGGEVQIVTVSASNSTPGKIVNGYSLTLGDLYPEGAGFRRNRFYFAEFSFLIGDGFQAETVADSKRLQLSVRHTMTIAAPGPDPEITAISDSCVTPPCGGGYTEGDIWRVFITKPAYYLDGTENLDYKSSWFLKCENSNNGIDSDCTPITQIDATPMLKAFLTVRSNSQREAPSLLFAQIQELDDPFAPPISSPTINLNRSRTATGLQIMDQNGQPASVYNYRSGVLSVNINDVSLPEDVNNPPGFTPTRISITWHPVGYTGGTAVTNSRPAYTTETITPSYATEGWEQRYTSPPPAGFRSELLALVRVYDQLGFATYARATVAYQAWTESLSVTITVFAGESPALSVVFSGASTAEIDSDAVSIRWMATPTSIQAANAPGELETIAGATARIFAPLPGQNSNDLLFSRLGLDSAPAVIPPRSLGDIDTPWFVMQLEAMDPFGRTTVFTMEFDNEIPNANAVTIIGPGRILQPDGNSATLSLAFDETQGVSLGMFSQARTLPRWFYHNTPLNRYECQTQSFLSPHGCMIGTGPSVDGLFLNKLRDDITPGVRLQDVFARMEYTNALGIARNITATVISSPPNRGYSIVGSADPVTVRNGIPYLNQLAAGEVYRVITPFLEYEPAPTLSYEWFYLSHDTGELVTVNDATTEGGRLTAAVEHIPARDASITLVVSVTHSETGGDTFHSATLALQDDPGRASIGITVIDADDSIQDAGRAEVTSFLLFPDNNGASAVESWQWQAGIGEEFNQPIDVAGASEQIFSFSSIPSGWQNPDSLEFSTHGMLRMRATLRDAFGGTNIQYSDPVNFNHPTQGQGKILLDTVSEGARLTAKFGDVTDRNGISSTAPISISWCFNDACEISNSNTYVLSSEETTMLLEGDVTLHAKGFFVDNLNFLSRITASFVYSENTVGIIGSNGLIKGSTLKMDLSETLNEVTDSPFTEDDFRQIEWFTCPGAEYDETACQDLNINSGSNIGASYVLNQKPTSSRPYIVVRGLTRSGFYSGSVLGRQQIDYPVRIEGSPNMRTDSAYSAVQADDGVLPSPYVCYESREAEDCGDAYPHGILKMQMQWSIKYQDIDTSDTVTQGRGYTCVDPFYFPDNLTGVDPRRDILPGFDYSYGFCEDERFPLPVAQGTDMPMQLIYGFTDSFGSPTPFTQYEHHSTLRLTVQSDLTNGPTVEIEPGNGFIKGSILSLVVRDPSDPDSENAGSEIDGVEWFHCANPAYSESECGNAVASGSGYALTVMPPAARPHIVARATLNRIFVRSTRGTTNDFAPNDPFVYYAAINSQGAPDPSPLPTAIAGSYNIATDNILTLVSEKPGLPDFAQCYSLRTAAACGEYFPYGISNDSLIEWSFLTATIRTESLGATLHVSDIYTPAALIRHFVRTGVSEAALTVRYLQKDSFGLNPTAQTLSITINLPNDDIPPPSGTPQLTVEYIGCQGAGGTILQELDSSCGGGYAPGDMYQARFVESVYDVRSLTNALTGQTRTVTVFYTLPGETDEGEQPTYGVRWLIGDERLATTALTSDALSTIAGEFGNTYTLQPDDFKLFTAGADGRSRRILHAAVFSERFPYDADFPSLTAMFYGPDLLSDPINVDHIPEAQDITYLDTASGQITNSFNLEGATIALDASAWTDLNGPPDSNYLGYSQPYVIWRGIIRASPESQVVHLNRTVILTMSQTSDASALAIAPTYQDFEDALAAVPYEGNLGSIVPVSYATAYLRAEVSYQDSFGFASSVRTIPLAELEYNNRPPTGDISLVIDRDSDDNLVSLDVSALEDPDGGLSVSLPAWSVRLGDTNRYQMVSVTNELGELVDASTETLSRDVIESYEFLRELHAVVGAQDRMGGDYALTTSIILDNPAQHLTLGTFTDTLVSGSIVTVVYNGKQGAGRDRFLPDEFEWRHQGTLSGTPGDSFVWQGSESIQPGELMAIAKYIGTFGETATMPVTRHALVDSPIDRDGFIILGDLNPTTSIRLDYENDERTGPAKWDLNNGLDAQATQLRLQWAVYENDGWRDLTVEERGTESGFSLPESFLAAVAGAGHATVRVSVFHRDNQGFEEQFFVVRELFNSPPQGGLHLEVESPRHGGSVVVTPVNVRDNTEAPNIIGFTWYAGIGREFAQPIVITSGANVTSYVLDQNATWLRQRGIYPITTSRLYSTRDAMRVVMTVQDSLGAITQVTSTVAIFDQPLTGVGNLHFENGFASGSVISVSFDTQGVNVPRDLNGQISLQFVIWCFSPERCRATDGTSLTMDEETAGLYGKFGLQAEAVFADPFLFASGITLSRASPNVFPVRLLAPDGLFLLTTVRVDLDSVGIVENDYDFAWFYCQTELYFPSECQLSSLVGNAPEYQMFTHLLPDHPYLVMRATEKIPPAGQNPNMYVGAIRKVNPPPIPDALSGGFILRPDNVLEMVDANGDPMPDPRACYQEQTIANCGSAYQHGIGNLSVSYQFRNGEISYSTSSQTAPRHGLFRVTLGDLYSQDEIDWRQKPPVFKDGRPAVATVTARMFYSDFFVERFTVTVEATVTLLGNPVIISGVNTFDPDLTAVTVLSPPPLSGATGSYEFECLAITTFGRFVSGDEGTYTVTIPRIQQEGATGFGANRNIPGQCSHLRMTATFDFADANINDFTSDPSNVFRIGGFGEEDGQMTVVYSGTCVDSVSGQTLTESSGQCGGGYKEGDIYEARELQAWNDLSGAPVNSLDPVLTRKEWAGGDPSSERGFFIVSVHHEADNGLPEGALADPSTGLGIFRFTVRNTIFKDSGYSQLRFRYYSPINFHAENRRTYEAVLDVDSPTEGAVVLRTKADNEVASGTRDFSAGEEFLFTPENIRDQNEADYTGQDENGIARYEYGWEVRDIRGIWRLQSPFQDAPFDYTPAPEHFVNLFPGALRPAFRARARVTDGWGLTANIVSPPVVYRDRDPTGTIALIITDVTPNATVSIDISTVSDLDGNARAYYYEWQTGVDGGVFSRVHAGPQATTYLIDTADFEPENVLLGIVRFTDDLGGDSALTATAYINKALTGSASLSLIGDIALTGATLTLFTDEIADDNGGEIISLEWFFDGVSRLFADPRQSQGPAGDFYVLAGQDVPPLAVGDMYAQVVFEDDLAFRSTLSVALSPVPDAPGTGTIGIDSTTLLVLPGETYTANISDIADFNGIGDFSYQWFFNEDGAATFLTLSEPGAESTYTIADSDVADPVLTAPRIAARTLRISVLHTDAAGYQQSFVGDFTEPVDNPSSGTVSVDGEAAFAEGQVYVANTDLIADDDGIGSFAYMWQTSVDGGQSWTTMTDETTGEPSETGQQYTLKSADFAGSAETPPRLRVRVVHSDPIGFQSEHFGELVYSDIPAIGTVAITPDDNTGRKAAGDVLNADISGVSDANGNLSATFQWQSGNTDDGFANIIGETAATYNIDAAHFVPQDSVRLLVTLTDPFGAVNSFSDVLLINESTQGQIGITLISGIWRAGTSITVWNPPGTLNDKNGEGSIIEYQWFVDDAQIAGMTNDYYVLRAEDLQPLASGASTLRLTAAYEDGLGFPFTLSATFTSPDNLDAASQGDVTIDGAESFHAGGTYTANINSISDENGLGGFAYQWFASLDDGLNYSPIDNATGSVYAIDLADFSGADPAIAPRLQVSVLHTDAAGFTASFLAATVHTDREIPGTLSISGNGRIAGDELSAEISGINLTNGGPLNATYQWQSGLEAENSYADIAGATNSVYVINADDFNPEHSVRVLVTLTGLFGKTYSFTVALQIEDATQGDVALSLADNIIRAGATVALDISQITDVNGGGFSYQWFIGASPIAGATSGSYILQSADLPQVAARQLSIRAEYQDSLTFTEIYGATFSPDQTANAPGEGQPAIEGPSSFEQGARYFANIDAVTDENGIGRFSYRWNVSFNGGISYTALPDGLTSEYILQTSHFAGATQTPPPQLRVFIVHTDAAGYPQGFFEDITHVDRAATGTLDILTNDKSAGGVLTADISGIADADGTLSGEYQWQSGNGNSFTNIQDATGSEYTIAVSDFNPEDAVRLLATVTDPFGAQYAFAATLQVNEPPTGDIGLILHGGLVSVGATVSLATDSVSDMNGGDFTSFQWFIGGSPANANDFYILQAGDLQSAANEQLSVVAAYSDSLAFAASFTATLRVGASGNIPGTGDVVINGASSFANNERYTANINGIEDGNGIGGFSYQWFTSFDGGTSYTPVPGASTSEYVLQATHFAGATQTPPPQLRISVVHTDAAGYSQTFTANIIHADRAAAGTLDILTNDKSAGGVLTADISGIADADGTLSGEYQWQSGNNQSFTNIQDATGAEYTIAVSDFNPEDAVRLLATVTDPFGAQYAFAATLQVNEDARGSLALSLVDDTLKAGASVVLSTIGVSDVNGGGFTSFQWFIGETQIAGATSYILAAGDLQLVRQEQLSVSAVYEDDLQFATTFAATLEMNANFDSPATGNVAITGPASFEQNAIYSADVSNIQDANGIGGFAYQWMVSFNDGNTYSLLESETASTYNLQTPDFANANAGARPRLRVAVTHTDGAGYSQTFIEDVIHADRAAAGALDILTNDKIAGGVLTADISGITDADGALSGAYQWQSGSGVSFENIPGATGSQYTISDSDFNPQDAIRLLLTMTDPFGFAYSFTATLQINEDTQGSVAASLTDDVLKAGATVVLSTSEVTDANGGGFTSFAWFVGESEFTGTDSYILRAEDLQLVRQGSLSVRAVYTDSLGFNQEFNQILTPNADSNAPTTGDVLIAGPNSFNQGAIYTADVSSIEDANGIGGFTYQWLASFDNGNNYQSLPGQTASLYNLQTSDFTNAVAGTLPHLRVSVVFTDAAGYSQALIDTVTHTDRQAGGSLGISTNDRSAGGILSADIFAITDADGALTGAYQWQSGSGVSFENIPGAIGSTYTISGSDFNPEDAVRLLATVTDPFGAEYAFTATLQINEPTTGGIGLILQGGLVSVGAAVSVATDSVSDINGGDFTSFQWFIGGSQIANASGDLYALQSADLQLVANQQLSVIAAYADSLTFATSFTATLAVGASGNIAGTGDVIINGASSFANNERYIANIDDIEDANGIGGFSYQWFVSFNGGTSYSPLPGASTSEYVLQISHFAGATAGTPPRLRVSVVHTDAAGYLQTFMDDIIHTDSPATGTLGISATTDKTPGAVLNADISGVNEANGISAMVYQWQNGSNNAFTDIQGATGSTYTIALSDFNPEDVVRVLATLTDTFGVVTPFTATLQLNDPPSGNITLVLRDDMVFAGATVSVAASGALDANGGGLVSYQWFIGTLQIARATGDSFVLAAAETEALARAGQMIVVATHQDLFGFQATLSAVLDIEPGSINIPGTGTLAIDGSPSFVQNGNYFANTGGISDDNGIGSWTYQWLFSINDGVSYSFIPGATGANYILQAQHFAGSASSSPPRLRVRAIHTDAHDFIEEYVAEIIHADLAATGELQIVIEAPDAPDIGLASGSTARKTAGNYLRADTQGITDMNGELSGNYQWQVGSGQTFTDMSEAMDAKYTLQARDFNPADTARLLATLSDPFGATYSFTATMQVAEQPSGDIRLALLGTLAEGATVTLITTDVTDINGGGFISFAWFIDGNEVAGATSDSYILQRSDLRHAAAGEISARAVYEDSLSFNKAMNAQLANLNADILGIGEAQIAGPSSFSQNARYAADISAITDANGIGTFTYQWFAGDAQSSVAIAGQTGEQYVINTADFAGMTSPWLRVSILHTDAAGYQQWFSADAAHTDRPSSGDIQLLVNDKIPGATVSVDISAISDPDGELTGIYQWQSGSGELFNNIAGENGIAYEIRAADFNPADTLRFVATLSDPFGGQTLLTAQTLINEESRGLVSVSLPDSIVEGGTVVLSVLEMSDANGGDFEEFVWFADNVEIARGPDPHYVLRDEDMAAALRGMLRVEATYKDDFGFKTVLTLQTENMVPDILERLRNARVEIVLEGREFNQHSASVRLQGANVNELSGVHYQWQAGVGGTFAQPVVVSAGASDSYLLSASDFNPHDFLRVHAELTIVSGDAVTIRSQIERINVDPTGRIAIQIIGGGRPEAGATLTADVSALQDANGNLAQTGMAWIYNGATVSNSDTYTLSADENPAGRIVYQLAVEDPARFATTLRTTLGLDAELQKRIRTGLSAINSAVLNNAWGAIDSHLSSRNGVRLNKSEVAGWDEVAAALAKNNSGDTVHPFQLDSFSANFDSNDDPSNWSWWTHGERSNLSGNPLIGDEEFRYDGRHFAFYAGADRQWGRQLRAGFAFSSDSANIAADLNGDGETNGRILQDMRTLIPYAKWQSEDEQTSLQFLIGLGYGKLKLEDGGNTAKADSRRKFAGLKISRLENIGEQIEIEFSAGANHVESRSGALDLGIELPAFRSSHSELNLNIETAHITPLSNQDSLRKFFNIRWRTQFGDLEEKALYDLGGGLDFNLLSKQLFFGIRGERQIGSADIRQERLNAYITYGRGSFQSTLNSIYGIDEYGASTMTHRWELGVLSEWGTSQVTHKFYTEHASQLPLTWGLESQVDF